MTEKQIKRGLKKLDKPFPLNHWDSWYNYYLSLKEHSTDSPAITISEIVAEYALGRNPLKRIKHENKEFQKGLIKTKRFVVENKDK